MKNIVSFMIMMETVYRAAGVLTNKTTTSVCQGLTATIDFSINLQGSTYGTESESWYFGSTRIATNPSGTFSPQGNYSSRLSSYSTYGISLSGVTSTDAGEYLLVFAVIAPTFVVLTATASLTVNIAPASSCVPYYSPTGGTYKCVLNQTAVSNNECGSPILQTNWTNGLGTSDITNIATSGNYTCCANGIAKNCYSGSYTFCETFSITATTTTTPKPGTTTTTTIAVTSSFLSSTSKSSTSSSATTDTTSTTTTVLPPNDTKNTSTSRSPTTVLPSSNTDIKVNVSTSANPTTAEPTAITKTSTDNNRTNSNISDTDVKVIVPAVVVPSGLLIILAIVLVIFCVRRKAGKNVRESPDGMAIQDKGNNTDGWKQSLGHGNNKDRWKQSFRHFNNIDGWKQSLGHGNNIDGWKQSLGHGKATDTVDTVYTIRDGFIIYPGAAAVSTVRSYKDKKYHGVTDQYSRPYPDTYGNQTVYFPSTYNSRSDVSGRDVQIQMEERGVTSNVNRPPAIHIRTQNRVESEPTSKKTKNRPQPMPAVAVVTEDVSKHRPQPPPPENSDVKDPNKRGLSANYDDTQGLPTGTPGPNRLTPLTPKQATVEKEDASKKKPTQKRKNKKKKGQMNEENQVEEMEESQSKKPLPGDQSDGD